MYVLVRTINKTLRPKCMHFHSQTTTCSTKFCTTFSYCKQWTLQRPCWKRAYIHVLMHKYLCTGSLKPIGFPFQILSHSFGKTSKEKIKNQKLGFKANAQMHVFAWTFLLALASFLKPFMFLRSGNEASITMHLFSRWFQPCKQLF